MESEIWNNVFFKLALESSANGKLLVDGNGIIKHVNSKLLHIFGYELNELIDNPLEILLPEKYRHQHPEHRKGFFDKPTVRAMGSGQVLYGLHKSSNQIPVEIGLNPLDYYGNRYVLADIVDISERLKAEHRFNLTIEASPNGVLLMNRSGNIVLVNSKIEEIFGYTREELINQPVGLLVPEHHRGKHPEFINHFLNEPKARQMGTGRDLHGLCKDGSEVPLEIGINPLEIDGVIHVLASIVDISERKQIEKERSSLNEQIQHAQRLESLGVLAGGTAHDFNNILQSISSNAELATMSLASGKNVTSYMDNIVKACRRASDLTKQMLAYAGKGRMLCSKTNINELISDISSLLSSTIPKKISLKKNLSTDIPIIEVDESQIQQIIMNLITNSSEAIGDKDGEIKIETGLAYETTESLKQYKYFEYLQEGQFLYIEVSDNGKGMPQDIVDSMFDPFFSTKFTGRGLGMAAVLGIIRSHCGTVQVLSEKNYGTTIKVILPVPADTMNNIENQTDDSGNTTDQITRQIRILVIDDEDSVSESLQKLLEMDNYAITVASSGNRGIEIIENGNNHFEIILLDMNMPGLSGAEVYAHLNKNKTQSHIILMSGYNELEVTSSIAELIGNHDFEINFLPKPFIYGDLMRIINRLLDK